MLMLALPGCALLEAVGLSRDEVNVDEVRETAPVRVEPARITVQHVLVSFDGAKSRTPGVTRTKDEAARLAERVFRMAQGPGDFTAIVRMHTDDRHRDGVIAVSNYGAQPEGDDIERQKLARAFADAAFALEPGQTSLVPYDEERAPFGWHVIRRIR
ncbi:MAG: hypothetical protein HMLKMBBP_03169 [Planctomycetes bacterium]|nr:hypothetical protein [Planctomycetota bacterium]